MSEVREPGKASNSGKAMEVDEESKKVVTVDATKVTEEKEEEADVEVAGTMGTKRSRRGDDKEEGEVRCGRMLVERRRCEHVLSGRS